MQVLKESGDLLLCKGQGKLSKLIEKTQRFAGYSKEESSVTHIAGLCYISDKLRDFLDLDFTGLGVFESTTLNEWAGEDGKQGVQINRYDKWLSNYNGEVYFRKAYFKRDTIYQNNDEAFISGKIGINYESGIPGIFELLFCGLGLHKIIRRFIPNWSPMSTKELHCSENEAYRLLYHKNIISNAIPNRMPPAFWWSQIDKLMRIELSKPIRIK